MSAPGTGPQAADAAWQNWLDVLDRVRTRMLVREECRHPRVREQALYGLQAMIAGGFHMYIAPRQDYPAFYKQTMWSPYETPWGGPAADMVYHWCFIDGRRSYRVWGRRGTTRFTDFQVFSGYFGDERMHSIGTHDLDAFEQGPGGEFEIILSPRRHPGNWIPLEEGEHHSMIQLRDTWYDWHGECGVEIHIEALDRPADSMVVPEAELNARMAKAARLVEQCTARALGYAKRTREAAGGVNRFSVVLGEASANRDHGASPRAGYVAMVWDLAPDEALILEAAPPQARYWSVQLMDLWWGTLDFSYHQSGLNGHQMQPDGDGRFRAVLSFDDPGVPNWLDPLRTPVGQCLLRWYDGSMEAAPAVRKVKLAELRQHLPAATPVITPEQRAAHLAQRARDSLNRWGY
jgi:hypothetical protein